jgi:hypothetical protein
MRATQQDRIDKEKRIRPFRREFTNLAHLTAVEEPLRADARLNNVSRATTHRDVLSIRATHEARRSGKTTHHGVGEDASEEAGGLVSQTEEEWCLRQKKNGENQFQETWRQRITQAPRTSSWRSTSSRAAKRPMPRTGSQVMRPSSSMTVTTGRA